MLKAGFPKCQDAEFSTGAAASNIKKDRARDWRGANRFESYDFFLAAASAYLRWKRSTRPAVSISFCLPVKNGWQLEQISTRMSSPLCVERVSNVLPQAQCTFTAW